MLGVTFSTYTFESYETIFDSIPDDSLIFVRPLGPNGHVPEPHRTQESLGGWEFYLKLTEDEKLMLFIKHGELIHNWREWDEGLDEDWHL